MSIDGDECVVTRTSAQCTSTRVPDAKGLGTRGRLEANIKAAVCLLISHLGVLLLLLEVGVVVDEIVPSSILKLGGHEMQRRKRFSQTLTRVTAGIDQQDLVASDGEVGGNRTSAWARPYDDILVAVQCIALADEWVMPRLLCGCLPRNGTVY